MSEDEQLAREYDEHERVVMYWQWLRACNLANGVVYSLNAEHSKCIGERKCVPDAFDWKWDFDKNRARPTNRVQCISHTALDRILRRIQS